MAFQTTVNNAQAYGVVGELSFDSPKRAKAYTLNTGTPANNVVGRALTVVSEGVAQVGGTGVFAGIFCDPKTLVSQDLGLLGPVANGSIVEGLTMGEIWVAVPNAAAIGDLVTYNTTTGILGTVAPVASGTGSITTTTLTISAVNAGSAPFAVGQNVTGPNILPNTVITALGTGTGGTGTYTVNQTQTAASGAVSANAVAPAGFALVPNAKIATYTPTAAGLASIQLTN